jgi:hypothetical protein
VRLAIPPHVRDGHPRLPKEIRRSTETLVRNLALAKAQKCVLTLLSGVSQAEGVAISKVLDDMVLALEVAGPNLVKSKAQGRKICGYVALSSEELRLFFEQPAFLGGAMEAPWR